MSRHPLRNFVVFCAAMGARGPHDDFETAKKMIVAAYANFNVDQDLDELHRRYLSDDLEYVTRFGTFRGPEKYLADAATQLKKWRLEIEVDEIVDAEEGAVLVLIKFLRKDRETDEVAWKAWPAVVMRVLDGKMVFFEGYIDRRQAFADYGVEQD
jgi:hypothetical protein